MKAFARWLYMKTHHAQLLTVKRYIEIGIEGSGSGASLRTEIGWKASEGALETLAVLDLLVREK